MNSFWSPGPWLGQVPLILGPSSWGTGMVRPSPRFVAPEGVAPFWGEWGVVEGEGLIGDCGQVGPFPTIEEAFTAAAKEARAHGATELPRNGFAQVKDSRGQGVGPIT